MTNNSTSLAINALNIEINGLLDLKQDLQKGGELAKNFEKTCNLLLTLKGKVVLSGVGKSGHIATKIASTLSSTGTQAMFLHPTEAFHGDLGIISTNDVVIALSKSGKSNELNAIINYCLRFNIPLIAITQNINSELAQVANIKLVLPKSAEACVLGLAPTTSSTVMLALGDALAVALLELKGFSKEDFKIFHPGGSLGSKLIKIKDIMHTKDIPLISNDSNMSLAIIEITKHKFGCIGVLDKLQNLIGIITDGDIRRNMSDTFLKKSVMDVMTKIFITIDQNNTAGQALLLMNSKKINVLFVCENNKAIGILHIHDLIRLGVE
jgi:arabinose-5-phosphate isomerase